MGGKREGAGRKPTAPHLKKIPIAVALPKWILDWMDTRPESRAVLIENALKKQHKIKPESVEQAIKTGTGFVKVSFDESKQEIVVKSIDISDVIDKGLTA